MWETISKNRTSDAFMSHTRCYTNTTTNTHLRVRCHRLDVATRSNFALPEGNPAGSTNRLPEQPRVTTKNHARPQPCLIRPRCIGDRGRSLDVPPPSETTAPTPASLDQSAILPICGELVTLQGPITPRRRLQEVI